MVDVIKRLKAAHLYLKSEFRLHIDDESQCGDHCMQFALSSTPRTHAHNSTCQSCNLIREVLADIDMAIQQGSNYR